MKPKLYILAGANGSEREKHNLQGAVACRGDSVYQS